MRVGISFTLMANFRSFERGQPFLIDNFYDLQKNRKRKDGLNYWMFGSQQADIKYKLIQLISILVTFLFGERNYLCIGNGCEAAFPSYSDLLSFSFVGLSLYSIECD